MSELATNSAAGQFLQNGQFFGKFGHIEKLGALLENGTDCINLPRCYSTNDSSALLACLLEGKKIALISGQKALAAAAKRLQIASETAALSEQITAAINTAKALQIGAFSAYFTTLPEREMAEQIAANIQQHLAQMQIFSAQSAAAQTARETAAQTAQDAELIILAVGGGVVCDVAKLVASLLGVRIITLPTIAATCAAASSLSVLYKGDEFSEFASFSELDLQTIVDFCILRAAPRRYFLAGLGDTLAKFYESRLQQRTARLDFAGFLGASIVTLCRNLLIDYEFSDCAAGGDCAAGDAAFKNAAMSILLATALVSRTIAPEHNGALAHAACYALHAQGAAGLHGELVAFGLLFQAHVMQNQEQFDELLGCFSRLQMPRKLRDFMREQDFCEEQFVRDVLAAEDVQNLLAADGLELERHIRRAACELKNF